MMASLDLPPLPEGWVWTRLGEISELIRGVSYPKAESSKEPKGGYIPILRANNINTELNFNDLVYVPLKRVKNEQLIKAFDVLIAMSSGSKDLVGKAAQAKHDFFGSFGTFCGLVRAVSGLDKKFVGVFFCSPDYRKEISRLSSGININNLRRAHIESMPIPIPPLPEQYRIAAKIEELFTKQDAGVKSLEKMKAQLKRYRQSVLKHAFEGKLTEEWRETHKDELEPASMLLERIKEEQKKNAKGKYKELPPLDTSELPELPEGWCWSSLEYYCKKITDGSHYTPKYTPDGYPFITISNVDGEIIDFSSAKLISEDDFNALKTNCNPHCGDILFSKDGTVGKVIEVNFEKEFIVLSSLAIIRPFTDFTYSRYLKFLLQSRMVLNQATKLKTGTALTRIILRNLKTVKIPIPHIVEQHKIVEEIERRFSVADNVEQAVDQSLKQAERLRQSILKRAFEGKLAPQDPTDEPACVLLERIKEDRENREIEAQSKTKTKRKRDLVQKQRRFNDYVK